LGIAAASASSVSRSAARFTTADCTPSMRLATLSIRAAQAAQVIPDISYSFFIQSLPIHYLFIIITPICKKIKEKNTRIH
jgi:hypothetical protein